MGRFTTDSNEMDLGYQLPEPGCYLLQFDEGIDTVDYIDKEGNDKVLVKLPVKIVDVIQDPSSKADEGDQESIGKTFDHAVAIETGFGEKQICSILTITDLAESFEKKFDDDTEFTDPQFIRALKLKLPDKMFCGEIFHKKSVSKKDGNEYTNVNLKRWWKLEKKKGGGKAKKKSEAVNEKAEDTDEDEDWG